MKKLKLVIIIVVALVVYSNIGYVFTYSLYSSVSQTGFSKMVYNIVDFYGVIGKLEEMTPIVYFSICFVWPIVLVIYWVLNSIALLFDVFYWLIAGGIFRWLELIR